MQYLTYLQSHSGWRTEVMPAFKDDGVASNQFFYIIQNGDNERPPEIIKLPVAQLESLAAQINEAVASLKKIDANKSDAHLGKQYVG